MKLPRCAVLMVGVLWGTLKGACLAATDVGPIGAYLPMDKDRIVAFPAAARAQVRGAAGSVPGQHGTAIEFAAAPKQAQGLTVTGVGLADPAHGTLAFWMKPTSEFKSERHALVSLLSSSEHDESLHLFIERGNLFLQSRAHGKWPGVHFGFDWIGKPPWRVGRWYHVAVTWGTNHPTTFYIDGRKTWEGATPLGFDGDAAPVDRIEIGWDGQGKQAGAVIDDLVVARDVLDEGHIGKLMVAEPRQPKVADLPPMGREAALPAGVKRVWDLARAYRESTPTRERICINGLWRWQPAEAGQSSVPDANWGHFKVPGCWPGITSYNMKDCQTVYPHRAWQAIPLPPAAAWYQREITIPPDWAGRHITIRADGVNSYADVYIDGKQADTIRFPGGRADITAACQAGQTHLVSLLVVAMPLHAIMLSYSDTNSAKQITGSVQRRGLCGDVFLEGLPARERLADITIDTSFARGEITFGATVVAGEKPAGKRLRATVADADGHMFSFEGAPFSAGGQAEARHEFTAHWTPARLWDTHTGGSTYTCRISLVDGDGRVLDTSCPERFGFREFRIEGRDFLLNGTRIFLSAVPLDTGLVGAAWASYEGAKENLMRLRAIGINLVYTHNYDCLPGSHLDYEHILRAADDTGTLVAFTLPHFGHYKWDAPNAERTNGYARDAAYYIQRARNHPSVVMYAMSHNATGYQDDMNPDMIDGVHENRSTWSRRNAGKAERAAAIAASLDPNRIVYHHSSGNLGPMHTSNFYLNWVPVQERSDWFEHWATKGVKPLFLVEYGMPISWCWAMYRGWYQGKRTFGSAQVPWEFCLAEWNAQFLGDDAFRISDLERANLRWEAGKFRAGEVWHRWDYPYDLGGGKERFLERHPVWAMYTKDNWRAFRTWGVSATSPWTFGDFWQKRDGVTARRRDLPVDWETLQQPGFSADYIDDCYERVDLAFERSDWATTVAGDALLANNQPLLAYVAGAPASFTGKGHNYRAAETVEKQIVIVNNSRETVRCNCSWDLSLSGALSGNGSVNVRTGAIEHLPIRFELPPAATPGTHRISLTASFDGQESQHDQFDIHIVGDGPRPQTHGTVALYDPKGETRELLDTVGVSCRLVGADADLAGVDVLVIGKAALTVNGPGPNLDRLRDGLAVLVFEQTSEVLEKRLGFRIQEYGLRRVFPRVSDHPVLDGLTRDHLCNWRGEATLVPPRRELAMDEERGDYGVERAGVRLSRVWRCGCRGNVASVLIEKPARGDFLPIVDGGFSLQYSPLLEYHEGAGLVVFCQMDVTGRTVNDAAAARLVRNLIGYVDQWKAAPQRRVMYAGNAKGRTHLESAGFTLDRFAGADLSPDHVLVVTSGAGKVLADRSGDIHAFLRAGGHVLAIGLDGTESNAILPIQTQTINGEHIAACFPPAAKGSLFAGVSSADVHNRDPRTISLVTGGAARPISNGVLASAANGQVVFCQLAPWTFDTTKQNQRRTFRRTSCLVTRLLGNLGARATLPLPDRFATSPAPSEARHADGLYLDIPQEWDDPYRFFRW